MNPHTPTLPPLSKVRRVLHSALAGLGVLLLSVLFPAPAQADPNSAAVPPGHSSTIIDVKFRPIVSAKTSASLLAPGLERSVAHSRPLFSLPKEVITGMRAAGRARSGKSVPDLSLWFRFHLQPGTDAGAFIRKLKASGMVEIVEPAPLPAPPPETTPDFRGAQGYVKDAGSGGIEARYSWSFPGGAGAGIKIYDIEYSWNQAHEDLSKAHGIPLLLAKGDSPSDPFGNENHGTAVLGELIADKDSRGVTGVSWAAFGIGLAPANTVNRGYDVANAIALAAHDGQAGDVILLEQQFPVCGGSCGASQVGCGPSEGASAVFEAIQTAVANGIVVVEAAGNGNVNLDQPACDNKFKRSARDSGAIIVGAGGSPDSGIDRQRLYFSSYGQRVDLQGWGNSVATTGYGSLYVNPDDPADPNSWYAASFGGTSSASPIVAGAVANLQGIALECRGTVLAPLEMRTLLVESGSAQLGNTDEHIGPRPDLRRAIARLCPCITQFVATNFDIGEGDGSVAVQVSRSGDHCPAGSVRVSTDDGTALHPGDYPSTSAELTWTAGELGAKAFKIFIANDALDESAETIDVILSAASAGTIAGGAATVTIIDDDDPPPKPGVPTHPAPGSTSSPGPVLQSQSPTFSWSPRAGATYYKLSVRDVERNRLVVSRSNIAKPSLTVALEGGRKFSWKVSACNSTGCSAETPPRFFQTPAGSAEDSPPPQPTNLSPGSTSSPGPSTGSNTVTFKWAAAPGAASYKLVVRDLATDRLVVNRTGYSGLSLKATLDAGRRYYWRVAACNAAGCSASTAKRYFRTP